MKMEADEKELLDSVERGEWKSAKGGKRERPVFPLREGYVPQGSAAEHSALEQGPGGDPEAGACRGAAVSDPDLESAPQVRFWPAQRGLSRLESGTDRRDLPLKIGRASCRERVYVLV